MMERARSGAPGPAHDRTTATSQGRYLSVEQAAGKLGVSRTTIWRWIRAGRLPITRLAPRIVRIRQEDLEHLLAPSVPHRPREASHLPLPGGAARAVTHLVQFYEADETLLNAVAGFIGTALRAGDAGIVIATEAHRIGIEERLRADGLDVEAAQAGGAYVPLDAAETLAQLMVAEQPDPTRLTTLLGGVIRRAAAGGRQVRVFGEMVALLVDAGNGAAALRLEQLWNALQQTHPFLLFCAYPLASFGQGDFAELLQDVCAEHGQVIPAEDYAELRTTDEQQRAITRLQQKAHWLEHEIAVRQQVEKQLQQALAAEQAARQQAEAAARARDEFLSVAAHELRTPLTILVARCQWLLKLAQRADHQEPPQLAPGLSELNRQIDKLRRLVAQLLDVSRLETGNLVLQPQPTDLVQLVRQSLAALAIVHPRRVITSRLPAELPAMVDPIRLEQVVTNLLDNACKYSPEESPITVSLAQTDQGDVELVVRDRGAGIAPERRAHLFERFYQAHDYVGGSGLGLGLWISRLIVELHGGTMWAEFPPDGGTCFVCRLSLRAERNPDA